MLVNTAWLDAWPNSSYICALPSTSDHSPLILSGVNRNDELAPFRFDNYLTHLPDFLHSVEDIWKHRIAGTAMYEIVHKLKLLKTVFRSQKKMTGNLTENVTKAKSFLDKAQALFTTYKEDIFLNLVKCCRRVFSVAVNLEIVMLKQRAKMRWMKHGDQNSKVFFRKINASRVKQRVFQIKTAGGILLTDQQDVKQEFISYFQHLLGGSSQNRRLNLEFLRADLKHTVTTTEADLLVAPVTQSEVKEAFFDIDVESAPGPDGYTAAFYRTAWPVVGQAVCQAVGEFFRTGKLLKQINATLIILIPKRILPLLIEYSQNAFVPGRSIIDNVLLAQELMAGYNQRRLPQRCTLKVDIQKAYDSVEWDFLLEVLRLFKFPTQFITLIDQCVSTASFSVSLNGSIHGFFKGGRGLRQGDPLSPYLFVLVMEIWNSLLRFRVRNAAEFQYHWKCKELGLKVNQAKSQIILSSSVQQERQQILEYLGFQEGSLPIRYLGIPLTSSRLTIADCRPLIDKVDARLAAWINQNLSYAGRLQLIKSVLSTLHTYWASAFILPKGVLKSLEKKMRQFLWHGSSGSGIAKVAWEQICKPREEGGLGIRSLVSANQALMLKQLWRIIHHDGNSIWVDWVHRYRLQGSLTKSAMAPPSTFWQDIWHERGPLCLSFPQGPRITGLPLTTPLSSVLQRNQWCWPALTDPEIVAQLPPTDPTAADMICWNSSSGKYTLKSAVLLIQPSTPRVFWFGLLQGKFKIPRHGFILWMAILEKLSTMDKPWVPRAENGCVLCGGQFDETHEHLFFNCWYSKRCLTILKRKIRFHWPFSEWQRGLTWASKKWRGTHLVNAAFRATLAALVYHLWTERNNRKFAATSSSAESITSRVLEDVRMRILTAECPSSLQLQNLYRIWHLTWPIGT
ncbi:UNVERIFIED_CONTAM: hypothetical protein Sangu_3245600 [Sesamum angustifolium]|uniref:Reverse transcriptase domain-containing protein n=2 Tax=Sesamum angustifolium TaxID=2727405 RepID=A0AAW2JHS2_9LAMI